MAQSLKLFSSTLILSYLASRPNAIVPTDEIAAVTGDHPSRVRQFVAALVKARLLVSYRGVGGGVQLARPAETITLRHVHEAVGETGILPREISGPRGRVPREAMGVYRVFNEFEAAIESVILDQLDGHSIAEIAQAWRTQNAEAGSSGSQESSGEKPNAEVRRQGRTDHGRDFRDR
ncbi:MAG: Rrf2 family transcriptional regulator [Burkholderiales bacterium]|nr:Rrf2 family transcriptional regulator [Burkholderiales bacterium]